MINTGSKRVYNIEYIEYIYSNLGRRFGHFIFFPCFPFPQPFSSSLGSWSFCPGLTQDAYYYSKPQQFLSSSLISAAWRSLVLKKPKKPNALCP